MFRVICSTLIVFATICYCEQKPAAAQDAQHEASAVVAREHGESPETAIATPTIVGTPPADNAANQAATKKPDTMKSRPGQQPTSGPQDRSNILGMYIQEGTKGQVRIVDVGPASPAYQAGIKRGDELVQFEKLRADNYRKWIDGIRLIVGAAPDGSQIPLMLVRDGNIITTQIRVPVSTTGRPQLPVGQLGSPQQGGQQPMPPTQQQPDAIGTPISAGGPDIAIQNGPFGVFFGGGAATSTERAMAELVRLSPGQQPPETQPPVSAGAAAASPSAAGASPPGAAAKSRIGMAGFRNESSGMIVMLDVGNLEPGNYRVAISDPSTLGNQMPPAPTPPPISPPGAEGQQPPGGQPGAPPAVPSDTPGAVPQPTAVPAPMSTEPGSPTVSQPPSSPSPIPSAIDPAGSTPGIDPAVPTPPPIPLPPSPAAQQTSAAMLNDLGTLTVDQSGTGRMQHVVEGIQVRNIIGQAIVISPQGEASSTKLPPDLDPTIDAAKPKSPPSNGSTAANTPASIGNSGAASAGGSKPVAGGIIRLLSDRNPSSEGQQADIPPATPGVLAPASNTPPVPPSSIR